MDDRAAARTAVTRPTQGAARRARDAFRHPGRPPLRLAARAPGGAREGRRAGVPAGGRLECCGLRNGGHRQGAACHARWSCSGLGQYFAVYRGARGQAPVVSRFEWGPDPGGGQVLAQCRSGGLRNSWGRDGAGGPGHVDRATCPARAPPGAGGLHGFAGAFRALGATTAPAAGRAFRPMMLPYFGSYVKFQRLVQVSAQNYR